MGPQHHTAAWKPVNISSSPYIWVAQGLHFPAPLVFEWHHISCQRNVGGSDTCHFRLIWLNRRCVSLHILPLPAHWVTPGWPFCSTRSTRWQSHKMEATWVPATLLGRELPDSGGMWCEIWGSALSIMALKEEHWHRTGLRAFSLGWLWGVRAIALLEKGGEWRASSYSHCGQEFPACSHPSQVTRGHSVSKRNRNPICQRGVVLWEKNFLYLVESDGLFSTFILVLIWLSWGLKPHQIRLRFSLSFSASLWLKCWEKLSSTHVHADTLISVVFEPPSWDLDQVIKGG